MKNKNKQNRKSLLYKIFVGNSISRKILSFYMYACIIGGLLLLLPISLKNGVNAYYQNENHPVYTAFSAFFVSISAFSDTGLTPVVISETYTFFGQIIILILIQLGGIGIFAIFWMIWNILFNNPIYKKVKGLPLNESVHYGFSNSLILTSERGDSKMGLSFKSIKMALVFIFVIEIVFSFIYSGLFYSIEAYQQVPILTSKLLVNGTIQNGFLNYNDYKLMSQLYTNGDIYAPYYKNYGLALWTGVFHSVSSMNNAGFDIFGPNSLGIYRNDSGTIIQYITIIEFILGGIGYPVIYDIHVAIKSKIHRRFFRWSLFTKTSIITYFVVAMIGLIFCFAFEFGLNDGLINQIDRIITTLKNNNNLGLIDTHILDKLQTYYGDAMMWNKITSVAFGSLATRSAGYATVNQSILTDATKWIYISFMFIGCAPSSTGGGIRTTTLAVIFMTLVSRIKANKNTRLFNRWIPKQTVVDSFIIFTFSACMISLFTLINYPIISTISNNFTMSDVFYEFSSAFGTVGLTSGITSLLTEYSISNFFIMLFLCFTMIIGQLGVTTSIFMFRETKKSKYSYELAYEDIKTC